MDADRRNISPINLFGTLILAWQPRAFCPRARDTKHPYMHVGKQIGCASCVEYLSFLVRSWYKNNTPHTSLGGRNGGGGFPFYIYTSSFLRDRLTGIKRAGPGMYGTVYLAAQRRTKRSSLAALPPSLPSSDAEEEEEEAVSMGSLLLLLCGGESKTTLGGPLRQKRERAPSPFPSSSSSAPFLSEAARQREKEKRKKKGGSI